MEGGRGTSHPTFQKGKHRLTPPFCVVVDGWVAYLSWYLDVICPLNWVIKVPKSQHFSSAFIRWIEIRLLFIFFFYVPVFIILVKFCVLQISRRPPPQMLYFESSQRRSVLPYSGATTYADLTLNGSVKNLCGSECGFLYDLGNLGCNLSSGIVVIPLYLMMRWFSLIEKQFFSRILATHARYTQNCSDKCA